MTTEEADRQSSASRLFLIRVIRAIRGSPEFSGNVEGAYDIGNRQQVGLHGGAVAGGQLRFITGSPFPAM